MLFGECGAKHFENEIAAVLSQLSIEPTEELDQKFQELVKKKRNLESNK